MSRHFDFKTRHFYFSLGKWSMLLQFRRSTWCYPLYLCTIPFYTVRPINLNYRDVIMSAMPYQITSLTIDYSTVYSGADQGKHQSSASLAFVRGIHRWPVNSPHKGPVKRKMFPFDDVIIWTRFCQPLFRCGYIISFVGNMWCVDPQLTFFHWHPNTDRLTARN